MTERCGRKLGPYIYAADAPSHSVDTGLYGMLQPRAEPMLLFLVKAFSLI
jgi:hypothetical protein